VLLGFEADLDWADINGRGPVTPTIFGVPSPFTLTAKTNIDWLGTARVRLGWAQENWLFYVTGGLAVTGEKTDLTTATGAGCGTFGVLPCHGSDRRVGAAAGLGFEYGFTPNWSAKVEYLYVSAVSLETSHVNMVRAGINYRFGGL